MPWAAGFLQPGVLGTRSFGQCLWVKLSPEFPAHILVVPGPTVPLGEPGSVWPQEVWPGNEDVVFQQVGEQIGDLF